MMVSSVSFLLLAIACPVMPAGSVFHAVICEPVPVHVFSTFDLCWEARLKLKADDEGAIAVCLDRSQLHSAEWTRGDGGTAGTFE